METVALQHARLSKILSAEMDELNSESSVTMEMIQLAAGIEIVPAIA